MDSDEQAQAYASADFSDANKIFLSTMLYVSSSLHGKAILDVGCGGGLLSEPISRIGANVTGIDASVKNIKIAKLHSKKNKLKIQ